MLLCSALSAEGRPSGSMLNTFLCIRSEPYISTSNDKGVLKSAFIFEECSPVNWEARVESTTLEA